ncbi:MAG: hypothetical protein HHJ15_15000 [Rhodoferax sp.]|uniref:hypothetical protein n=1 Tax=Rhodoferax sp. TaxID=50421 RepID=UPI0018058392|nr:hypothetical protein [Rhodoferax sp.]NMM21238.1 hypothetical protein [Rhodoferax sp.]
MTLSVRALIRVFQTFDCLALSAGCWGVSTLDFIATPTLRRNVIATLKDYETDARALMAQKH